MNGRQGGFALVWRNSTPIRAQSRLIGAVIKLHMLLETEIIEDDQITWTGDVWTFSPRRIRMGGYTELVADCDLLPLDSHAIVGKS